MLCIATQSVINTDLLSCSKSFFLYSCCQLEIDMMSFIDLIHFWLNKINIFPLLNNLPILTFSSRRRGILPAEAAELRRRVISWFVPLLAEKKEKSEKEKKRKILARIFIIGPPRGSSFTKSIGNLSIFCVPIKINLIINTLRMGSNWNIRFNSKLNTNKLNLSLVNSPRFMKNMWCHPFMLHHTM